ncbi:YDG domain-containing protein At5g47160-like [Impatiens glandulifera]|uniref:YDG domain-containing protein At5g47160-like n=1 Tax=Impatiens glandulifera TaxID=253017 RepID=UPI001FB1059A|nr:YDG domain-containing protein At5g47160-like [Impatiens glandulifera]
MKPIGFTQNKDSNSAKTRNNMYVQRPVAVNRPKYLGINKHEYLACLKKQISNGSKLNEKTKIGSGEVLKSEFYLSRSTKQKTEVPKKKESYSMTGDILQKKLRIFKIIYDDMVNQGKSSTRNYWQIRSRAAKDVEKKFGRCSPKVGAIPGVKIGDKFNFRVELALVGLHMPPRSGIDTNFSVSSSNPNEHRVCTSIVVSDRFYENDMKNPDYLIYSGHGGIGMRTRTGTGTKVGEDQKLVGGNLALMNSKRRKNEVRVIRTRKENGRLVYVYDGLYVVETSYKVRGSSGNLIFKFGLKRIH